MRTYSLSHVPDPVLLRDLAALVARDRATTATLLAHLAEVDARRLYLPAAHPSMYSYCVHELGLSEDAAFKRIRAARTARRFPAVFEALADGRLHLSAVVRLSSYLTPENAEGLLAAAAHQRRAGLERLLAKRFPRPDLPERLEAIGSPVADGELAPGPVASPGLDIRQLAPGPVEAPGLGQQQRGRGRPEPCDLQRLAPLAPQRFALQLTLGRSTHDKLRYAQALLAHQLPSGDLEQVLDRALDALIGQLERRKFAATSRPRRRPRRSSANPRHIPAEVKRQVWERDGGRCTFVSEAGRRCPARSRLEFDHLDPVARGGRATVARIRLRCRAHNQYAAECAFGVGFMSRKRAMARDAAARDATDRKAAAAVRAQAAAARDAAAASARAGAASALAAAEVIPWLRRLGLRADEARRAAARCESIPEAPPEERVRVALSCFAGPSQGRAGGRLPAPT